MPVPEVSPLRLEGAELAFYSADERAALRLSAGDGHTQSEVAIKPILRNAWVVGDVVYGNNTAYEGGPSSLGVFRPRENVGWVTGNNVTERVTAASEGYVVAGRQLLKREDMAIVVEYPNIVLTPRPDMILVCDHDGRQAAVDPKTTGVYWKVGTCSGLVATDTKYGARIATSAVELFRLSTGETVWSRPIAGAVHAPRWGFSPIGIDEGRIYVATDRGITATSLEGDSLWTSEPRGPLVAGGGAVVVATGYGLRVLDGESGRVRYDVKLDGDPKAGVRIVIGDGKLFVRTDDDVSALDLVKGTVVWREDIDA
ncbi:MAG: PQQ-like beta-propeller repeat protein [Polyangiaceae bacterium]|nr:PQQ-like beta-propeller repeat protein [Polyangiaceae bacterium]